MPPHWYRLTKNMIAHLYQIIPYLPPQSNGIALKIGISLKQKGMSPVQYRTHSQTIEHEFYLILGGISETGALIF